MSAQAYQTELSILLATVFQNPLIKKEWSIRSNSNDVLSNRGSYAPRLDLAVGPYNLSHDNAAGDATKIKSKKTHPLVAKIIEKIETQSGRFFLNQNPRCLIGIELEWATSSKHMLGGITNASMMGLVGVLITPPGKLEKAKRIAEYVRSLKSVGKSPMDLFGNIACIEAEEFKEMVISCQ